MCRWGMSEILPGTGRGTAARSAVVEGARGGGLTSDRNPLRHASKLALHLPVPGRI
jgi:hypothetical protein